MTDRATVPQLSSHNSTYQYYCHKSTKMGKKSKRNSSKNNTEALGKGQSKVAAPGIYDEVCRLLRARKYDEILKVESKYRHLDTFSNNSAKEVVVLTTFGMMNKKSSQKEMCLDLAIDYYERAFKVLTSIQDEAFQAQNTFKIEVGMSLAHLFSEGRDMEKSISSHRWLIANCNRDQVTANYMIQLSHNFSRFEKYEYMIEVLEGSMHMMKTFDEDFQAEMYLIEAYIGRGEFLKAKAANKIRRSIDVKHWAARLQSGRIEDGLCNFKAAIIHYRKVAAELEKQEYNDSLSETRVICSMDMATNLLKHSAANEAEAFAIFQEELDRCVDPLCRKMILFQMGTWYRKLSKWDQSIEAFHQLSGLSSTHPHGAMAQTCLEQYCTDTTLDIDQCTKILSHATYHFNQVDEVSTTEMQLTQAQLFYFNGDKHEAYHHLELYLDARLAECKLSCYTCAQRVRHGSVPFSCESCRVASYCCRKHQKLTWKYERICHKVLCPLLGYWRMTKKKETKDTTKKKQKKHKGLRNEDRREYERVFETFFESICPHVKACVPL